MFCKKCGSEVPDGMKFCTHCGTAIEQICSLSKNEQGENPVVDLSKKNDINSVTIAKMLLLVAILCFFLPFVAVSCQGQSADMSGFDAMLGDTFNEDSELDLPVNIFLLIAFVLGVINLFTSFEKKKNKAYANAGFSALGAAVMLLICRFSLWSYYDLNDNARYMLDFDFRYGWWLSLLSFIGSGLCFLYKYGDELPDDDVSSTESKETPDNDS